MSLLANATNVTPDTAYFIGRDQIPNFTSTIASQWALYPAISSINCANYPILSTPSLQLTGQILTAGPNVLYLNGDPIVTSTAIGSLSSIADWSYYNALSTVNMNSHGLSNATFAQIAGGVVTTSGNNILVNAVNPVTQWATFGASSNPDINSKNINNANQLNFITAVPGPLTTGATINSLNSLNFSYATALVLQAGINNLNNIAFWNPNFPGVPGFYVNLFSKNLTYLGGGATYLASDTNLSVPALYTSAVAGFAGGKIEALTDTATYATINGNPCPAVWATFRASADVNMNFNQILSCRQIDFAVGAGGPFNLLSINAGGNLTTNGSEILPLGQWATTPAVQNVDMNNHELSNASGVKFNAAGHLLTTDGSGNLLYNGAIINGDVQNWAQYNANNNVTIPAAYSLSINAENSLVYYKDSHLNTNIYHGVEGNVDSPDFISFPTTFQVGTTLNPAREITMTAGALGFGINSDTEVNIDATVLVNISSEAVVSIEATEFNLTSGLTTFEIGEWNTTAAATTFEVGSFDLISAGNVAMSGTLATILFGATTITTAGLGITAGATVIGVASMNTVSAGNVTTSGTQIGFTAGTTFNTTSVGNTNLIAQDTMNIQGTNQINLTAPIVAASAILKAPTVKADTIQPNTGTSVSIPSLNLSTVTGIASGVISYPTTAQLYYNTSTKKVFYDATPFSIIVTAGSSVGLAAAINEESFVLTGSGTFNFITAPLAGVASGFYVTVKNGTTSNITIQENGATIAGPASGVLYGNGATNAAICYIYWNGTSLIMY